MAAYYNENDAFAAAWLRELITKGLIAEGEVDERSIADVQPDDLEGFAQHHFFAGIGGWPYALGLAGWPDSQPVWTGSCPCQPFSAAGKGEGFSDPRHLWPEWFRLIRECRPVTVFGEQVDKALAWLDLVSGDLEDEGYAVGAAIVGAHSVGAPHRRQRIYWVGESAEGRRGPWRAGETVSGQEPCGAAERSMPDGSMVLCGEGELGDDDDARSQGRGVSGATGSGDGGSEFTAGETSVADGLGISYRTGSQPRGSTAARNGHRDSTIPASFWADCDWLPCIDGKSRPVEPGTFPLAHGVPSRVGRLRGYGNAIVPQVAAEFIIAYMECQ